MQDEAAGVRGACGAAGNTRACARSAPACVRAHACGASVYAAGQAGPGWTPEGILRPNLPLGRAGMSWRRAGRGGGTESKSPPCQEGPSPHQPPLRRSSAYLCGEPARSSSPQAGVEDAREGVAREGVAREGVACEGVVWDAAGAGTVTSRRPSRRVWHAVQCPQ